MTILWHKATQEVEVQGTPAKLGQASGPQPEAHHTHLGALNTAPKPESEFLVQSLCLEAAEQDGQWPPSAQGGPSALRCGDLFQKSSSNLELGLEFPFNTASTLRGHLTGHAGKWA